MTPERFSEMDYEGAQAEKRNRLGERLQVWSLLFALVTGFGLVSAQSGNVSYVVLLYPMIACCLARAVGHSEAVLDQVKAYLLDVEEKRGYSGYEKYNESHKLKSSSSGGHKKALRDALMLTESLATALVVWRLLEAHMPIAAVVVLVIEALAVIATARFLWEKGK